MSFRPEFRRLVSSMLLGAINRSECEQMVTEEGFLDFLKQEGLSPPLHFQFARLRRSSLFPPDLRLKLRKDYFGQCLIEDLRHERSRVIFQSIQSR